MADTIEKIYCTDGRDNDLAAILAATKNNDPATVMAAMGGGMEFMRWTSDAIGKSLTLNWEDFI